MKLISVLILTWGSLLFSQMAIDTGNCYLGLSDTPCEMGVFQYPRFAPSCMYASSMLLGNSEHYVVDCFGQTNPVSDWRWIESWLRIIPPLFESDQTFRSLLDDGNHPTAKGIRARRFFIGRSSQGFDDFVILIYNYINPTDSTISGLYAGVFCDLDLGTAPTANWGRTNTAKRFTYMTPTQTNFNPTVGVRLLYPRTAINLSLIDHGYYVYPGMTERTKLMFLDGTIRLPNTARAYDYSICVSAGPFNFPPHDSSTWVVFALVGGQDTTNARIHSDSAQSWCDREITEVEEELRGSKQDARLKIWPNPGRTDIRFQITDIGVKDFKIKIYSVTGKLIKEIPVIADARKHIFDINVSDLPAGTYFVELKGKRDNNLQKLIIIK